MCHFRTQTATSGIPIMQTFICYCNGLGEVETSWGYSLTLDWKAPWFLWPQASQATHHSQSCLGEIGGTRATRSRSSKYSSCTILRHSSHQSVWALLCFGRISEGLEDAHFFTSNFWFVCWFFALGGEKGWTCVFVKHSFSCFQVRGLKPLHLQLTQSNSPDPLRHYLLDDPTLGEDCERLICNECARPLAKERLAKRAAGVKRVGCAWLVPWLSGTYFYPGGGSFSGGWFSVFPWKQVQRKCLWVFLIFSPAILTPWIMQSKQYTTPTNIKKRQFASNGTASMSSVISL